MAIKFPLDKPLGKHVHTHRRCGTKISAEPRPELCRYLDAISVKHTQEFRAIGLLHGCTDISGYIVELGQGCRRPAMFK